MAPMDEEVAVAVEAWGKDDAAWKEPWSDFGSPSRLTSKTPGNLVDGMKGFERQEESKELTY